MAECILHLSEKLVIVHRNREVERSNSNSATASLQPASDQLSFPRITEDTCSIELDDLTDLLSGARIGIGSASPNTGCSDNQKPEKSQLAKSLGSHVTS